MLKIGIFLHCTNVFAPARVLSGFRYTVHVTSWVNMLFHVTFTLVETLGCTPRARLWDVTREENCVDVQTINITSAFVNFFSDFIIMLLPQRVIWKMHMSTRKRVGLAALFAVGIL